jgi:pimeloyl-ACP methyl ester carboxylesterase
MKVLGRSFLSYFALLLGLLTLHAQTVGIVLIHGKQGMPGQFERMAGGLEGAGYLTERPEMCWSRRRIYDKPYLECIGELDVVVARLRLRGAREIVIAGMSLGGNGVLGYGARHDGLKGIVAFAPAHAPEFISRRPEISASLDRARTAIADGKGDVPATFSDVNTGPGTSNVEFTVTVTPRTYVSFFAPDSPAVMPTNAAKLKAPLLVISGTQDQTQRGARAIFEAAPSHALNRFVSIEATHMETPAKGREAMMTWLRELAGH